jgi:Domain of unknown function (DUF4062)
MEKRYQVFVSSTYEDLREERQEVMQALLELDCIPSGMELFPATNEDQWTLIKKVIDDCDYYLVIVAGRYGSIGPSGKSYTQMEFEYAVVAGKPVIGFLHASPQDIAAKATEKTEAGKVALEVFRTLIKERTVRTFRSASELGSVVSRSVIKLIKTNPASGWIRADEALDQISASEILRLRKQNEELRAQINNQRDAAPAGADELAQGAELYEITFDVEFDSAEDSGFTWAKNVKLSWNEISGVVLSAASAGSEEKIGHSLETRCFGRVKLLLEKTEKGLINLKLKISDHDLRTILVQLQALGLIKKSVNSANKTLWTTTSYGETTLIRLYAIPKKVPKRTPARVPSAV